MLAGLFWGHDYYLLNDWLYANNKRENILKEILVLHLYLFIYFICTFVICFFPRYCMLENVYATLYSFLQSAMITR